MQPMMGELWQIISVALVSSPIKRMRTKNPPEPLSTLNLYDSERLRVYYVPRKECNKNVVSHFLKQVFFPPLIDTKIEPESEWMTCPSIHLFIHSLNQTPDHLLNANKHCSGRLDTAVKNKVPAITGLNFSYQGGNPNSSLDQGQIKYRMARWIWISDK